MIPADLALCISCKQRCLVCSNCQWTEHALHMQRHVQVFIYLLYVLVFT